MRRIALMLAVLTVFGVAGCNNNNSSKKENAGATKTVSSVSGTVGLLHDRTLSPQAKMQIQLVDASSDGAQPLATKNVDPVEQMPVQFTLDFKPAKINASDIYVVDVKLVDGDRTFNMPVQAPVLTKGAPNSVNIKLQANMTPPEKMMAAFKKVEANLGGYKINNGKLLEKKVSHGWQTFRNNQTGKILFVRENTVAGDKSFIKSDFAYQDGKPWVVVVKHKSSKSARASSTDRAGWDENGKLVVHEHVAGGKTSPLSESDAATLKKQAQSMLKLARKQLPKSKK